MKRLRVIAIVGPTASGKSALGVYLAQKLHGEVISADSRQVYRGLNLGTGKVTVEEMGGIPHHLLDVISPKKVFTASDFVTLGAKAFEKIHGHGNIPFVVGGTGLYVDALLGRMLLPNVPPNKKLRANIEKKSAEELFAMLKKIDPRRATTIEPKNIRRLVRAIEIAKAIGASQIPRQQDHYSVLWLGINPSPKVLAQRIHKRLECRLKAGMVAEVRQLHARGLSYKKMRTLGIEYRFISQFLQSELSKIEMCVKIERESLDYAKRQIRWFNKNSNIIWVKNRMEALALAKKFLTIPTGGPTRNFSPYRSSMGFVFSFRKYTQPFRILGTMCIGTLLVPEK